MAGTGGMQSGVQCGRIKFGEEYTKALVQKN